MPTVAVTPTMLRMLPLLSQLAEDELLTLLPHIQHRSYSRHARMVGLGEKSDSLFVILAGKAKITMNDGAGRETTLSTIGSGEVFGEMSFVDGEPRSASVIALEACEVLYVPNTALKQCLHNNFDVVMHLLKVAVGRLRQADRKIATLALMDVRGRVARLIMDLAREVQGVWIVDTGSEEIARMIGASREMVSRVVRQMVDRGLVRRDGRKLIVLDRASLPECSTIH
jgi:CRP/FNR family transcriptional regulator, cyclic AMP receptor protein